MAIYETIDSRKRVRGQNSSLSRREQMLKSHSMEALETPTPSVNGEDSCDNNCDRLPMDDASQNRNSHSQQQQQHFQKQEKHVKRRHR